MKHFFATVTILTLICAFGCESQVTTCNKLTSAEIKALQQKVAGMPLVAVEPNEVAVLETNYGKLVLTFFMDKAPQHCKAFKRLVNAGFYDCTQFHRIIQNFVIQGGDILTRDNDPKNDGTGGPGYMLPAEFNKTPHDKGILSMARAQDPNSGGSQFFICLSRKGTAALDGQYTVFGKVIEGLDVVDKIAAVKTSVNQYGEASVPVKPVFIQKAYMQKR
jgi:peptidyl-prolyl cis-trans isomerase B (cyclophilin B)